MLRVLIWCNVGSCSRVSGVMGVAMVVCLMRASGVMGAGVFVCLCADGIWCDESRCVCVLRVSGVMWVGVFVC